MKKLTVTPLYTKITPEKQRLVQHRKGSFGGTIGICSGFLLPTTPVNYPTKSS